MTTSVQNIPASNLSSNYLNGFLISWTSNTKLTITNGQVRDYNNILDILCANGPYAIDATINGAGGLDTGALANNTLYAIYAISSSQNLQQPDVIASTSFSGPTMPFQYDSWQRIGSWRTDGSAHLRATYQIASGLTRSYVYDAFIQVVTSGSSTTGANVSLSQNVPQFVGNTVDLFFEFTPNAAGHGLYIYPFGDSGSMSSVQSVIGQVASVPVYGTVTIPVALNSGASFNPYFTYAVDNGSDVANIFVKGYTDRLANYLS